MIPRNPFAFWGPAPSEPPSLLCKTNALHPSPAPLDRGVPIRVQLVSSRLYACPLQADFRQALAPFGWDEEFAEDRHRTAQYEPQRSLCTHSGPSACLPHPWNGLRIVCATDCSVLRSAVAQIGVQAQLPSTPR